MNPLILLDEIDKLTCDAHGDPASALLEVLDGEQNKTFRDHFTEIPIDLSECIFLATANTLDTVARPLIDRMEILRLNTYTRTEKLRIAKNHLIPKQLKKLGMTKGQCSITPSATAELIDYYTAEAGVRNLERELAALCRKAAKELLGGAEKITIRAADVQKYLGARRYLPEKLAPADEVGVVNGLAYTSVGGDILKIEAAVLDGSGKIEMTGSLGDVMRESAKLAVSYVRMIAKDYGIDGDFYKTKDIHIHFPEGAVPKDGPSAGAAIVCALVSALSGAPVRRDVAMTGEFSLRGPPDRDRRFKRKNDGGLYRRHTYRADPLRQFKRSGQNRRRGARASKHHRMPQHPGKCSATHWRKRPCAAARPPTCIRLQKPPGARKRNKTARLCERNA